MPGNLNPSPVLWFVGHANIFRCAMIERLTIIIAWLLPRRLVYWCAIRLGSEATVRNDEKRYEGNVPDMTFMDALKRW